MSFPLGELSASSPVQITVTQGNGPPLGSSFSFTEKEWKTWLW
jgi:hypothetical protein